MFYVGSLDHYFSDSEWRLPIAIPRGEGSMSGMRLAAGQDKALKGAGKEYMCTRGILGVWICSGCS